MTDDDKPLVWKDPPKRYRHAKWDNEAIAAELRQHPGQWAIIARCNSASQASNVAAARRNLVVAAYRSGRWEFQASGGDVYARFLGDDT